MTINDVKNLSFVIDEGNRYKISAKKAGNSFVLNSVLQLLKNEGYSFYRLFAGGYIYASKTIPTVE